MGGKYAVIESDLSFRPTYLVGSEVNVGFERAKWKQNQLKSQGVDV